MINGTGFLIWRMSEIRKYVTPVELVDLCLINGIRWLSVKIADGEYPVNKEDEFSDYYTMLKAAGIELGGWPYCYPYQPARPDVEARLYDERAATLGLSHLLLDVEMEWKKPNLGKQIDQVCKLTTSAPVALCSYRFPNFHPGIDWRRWLNQKTIDFVAPQVYWEGAHNPGQQLRRSYDQYRKLTLKPYIPIGCTYGRGKSWEPTCADLAEFMATCKALGFSGYGFYSLDWLLKHHKYDWLAVIGGASV